MKWTFWKPEPQKPTDSVPTLGPKPRVWIAGWDIEVFEVDGRPAWCAATTVYEVFALGTAREQFWERRLRVCAGDRVHLDQQPGRPIADTPALLGAITAGRVVYVPPDGGEVYRPGAVFKVNIVASNLGGDDLACDVRDVQGQLGGDEPRVKTCRRALTRWAADPTDENLEVVRQRYYSMSRQARRFLMGMDAKDNGVRMLFEAKDEQARAMTREALLNTCRLYADEFKE